MIKLFALVFFILVVGCDETENFEENENRIPTDGLIVYYAFDGNVDDSGDSLNHCIDFSSKKYVNGISGLAKEFDGKNDYLMLSKTLNSSKGLTISFWAYIKGFREGENNGTVICKYNKWSAYRCFTVGTKDFTSDSVARLSGNFYALPTTADYRDCAWSNITAKEDIPAKLNPEQFTIHNPTELPQNEWVHCLINVTKSRVEAWVDGILTVSKEREYEEYFDSENEPTYIGNNLLGGVGVGNNNHFYGYLDELRVYNRDLSEKEIQILYLNPN